MAYHRPWPVYCRFVARDRAPYLGARSRIRYGVVQAKARFPAKSNRGAGPRFQRLYLGRAATFMRTALKVPNISPQSSLLLQLQ